MDIYTYIRLCVYYNKNREGTSVNDSYQKKKKKITILIDVIIVDW